MAAIYMWRKQDILVLTTTLYPVEVVETMIFGATFTEGSMTLIPQDFIYASNTEGLDGLYEQKRWFYTDGPYIELGIYADQGALDGLYEQKRWFYTDSYEEPGIYADQEALDGIYKFKLVKADTPDELLQLSAAIAPAGCSMELI